MLIIFINLYFISYVWKKTDARIIKEEFSALEFRPPTHAFTEPICSSPTENFRLLI